MQSKVNPNTTTTTQLRAGGSNPLPFLLAGALVPGIAFLFEIIFESLGGWLPAWSYSMVIAYARFIIVLLGALAGPTLSIMAVRRAKRKNPIWKFSALTILSIDCLWLLCIIGFFILILLRAFPYG
jgi:hypothetical protein